jgi:hypothetical protein
MWCYRHGFCKNPWRSWEKHRTRVLGRALGDASSTFVDPFLRWGVDEGGVQKDGDTENDPAIDDPHMRSSLKRETCSFICRYTLSMMCLFMQHNIQCIYIYNYICIYTFLHQMRSIKYVDELEFFQLTKLSPVALGLRRSSFSCSWSNSTMRCCAWSNLKSKLIEGYDKFCWWGREKFQRKEIPWVIS